MAKYNRVLLKLSGEALSGDKGQGFDEATVLKVGEQVKKLIEKDIEVGIVIGGGNFWRGRSNENMDRTRADQIGMLATVLNCIYTSEMFRTLGIPTSIVTPFKIGEVTNVFNKDLCMDLFKKKTVVFFAGGTGHPYFSTDTAAALRAIETECDVILLAKNIDGVYSADPKVDKEAIKYKEITLKEVIDKELKVMDSTAAIMCLEHKVGMNVFHLNEENSILNSIEGNENGTNVMV